MERKGINPLMMAGKEQEKVEPIGMALTINRDTRAIEVGELDGYALPEYADLVDMHVYLEAVVLKMAIQHTG